MPLSDHDRVRRTWAARGAGAWTQALVDGVVPGGGATPEPVGKPRLVLPRPIAHGPALVLTTPPSAALWDGRQAANAWAQETPDPLTKEVWGPALRLSAEDARRLDLADGDAVTVAGAGAVAARIVAGQAPGVATLPMGGGRRDSGPVADGIGLSVPAAQGAAGWREVVLTPGGEARRPLSTQGFFALDGDTAKLFPVVAPGAATRKPDPHPTLLPPPPERLTRDYQWAMVIDTDVCIGCNACVVACQAENNVPVIGPAEIGHHRDMHWLRVDRYDRGDAADPRPGFQPVPCMQCEEAPCEPVCPVEASVHDDQGLNVQVYNRCIGTRTCQANCPYKVRRFNFRDNTRPAVYEEVDSASLAAQRNPDVTVRARGVMEKCTYCVQRIEAARHDADAFHRPIGEVTTACQAACPTNAIVFGDLKRPGSAVNAGRADPRHYALLEELGTRPRTTYLARVRDDGGAA
ncbi:4Fe-4S dicluster domain-containing protein [Sphingomonas sp.]|uniref:4Fe-4S dicluster domain-containing protein n=1 Tax=Sphingomonas sp. TaxID=28214 RepID=UPI003B00C628